MVRNVTLRRGLLCLAVVAPVVVVVLLGGWLFREGELEEQQRRRAPSKQAVERIPPDTIECRVRGANEQPVAGVEVGLWLAPPPAIGGYRVPSFTADPLRPPPAIEPHRRGTTREDGVLLFEGLPPGAAPVVRLFPKPPLVVAPLRRGAAPPANQLFVVPAPAHSPGPRAFTLRVEEGVPFEVQVVDGKGAGVEGYVQARWFGTWTTELRDGTPLEPWTASDAAGRVRFPAVRAETVGLRAFVPGVGLRDWVQVDTAEGGSVEIPLGVEDGAVVEGTVAESGGEPIPGAVVQVRVRALEETLHQGTWIRYAVTGEDGRYRVANLPAGELRDSRVECEGFAPGGGAGQGLSLRAGEVSRLNVRLVRACAVEGIVHSSTRVPLAGVRVVVGAPRRTPNEGLYRFVVTDAEGRYRVDALAPGEVNVRAVKAEYHALSTTRHDYHEVRLEQAGETKQLDIELVECVAVSGRVVDAEGAAVSGVEVRWSGGLRRGRALTGEDGCFRTTDVPPAGPIYLNASVSGTGWAKSVRIEHDELLAGAAPAELTLIPYASIQGRVIGSDGVGRSECPVRLIDGRGRRPRSRATSKEDGAFKIGNLRPGEYRVQASTSGRMPLGTSEVVHLTAGQRRTGIVVQAAATQHVRGVVVNEIDEPIAKQGVTLKHKAPVPGKRGATKTKTLSSRVRTDDEGRFDIELVWPPDGTLLVLMERDGLKLTKPVTSSHETLRFVFPRPPVPGHHVELEGRVFAPSGEPLPVGQIEVFERRPNQVIRVARTAVSEGRFHARLELVGREVFVAVNEAKDLEGKRVVFAPWWRDDVRPGDGPLEIHLETGLPVRVAVLDERLKGVPGIRVDIRQDEAPDKALRSCVRREFEGITDAEGCVEVAGGFGSGRTSATLKYPDDNGPWGGRPISAGSHWNELLVPEPRSDGVERPSPPRQGAWATEAWFRSKTEGASAVFLGEVEPARATSIRIVDGDSFPRFRSRLLAYPYVAYDAMRTVLRSQGFDRIVLVMERIIPRQRLQDAVDAYIQDRSRAKLKTTIFELHRLRSLSTSTGRPQGLGWYSGDHYGHRDLPDRGREITVGYVGTRKVAMKYPHSFEWIYREALAEYETLRILADAAVQAGVPLHVYSTNERRGVFVAEKDQHTRALEKLQQHMMDGRPLVCVPGRHATLANEESLAARCAAYFRVFDKGSKHPTVIQVIEARRAPERARLPAQIRLYDGGRSP